MSSELPPDLIPHTVDLESLKRAKRILADPVGEPVHPTTIQVDRRPEVFTEAAGLDPDYRWFYLGFAMVFINPGRSLFEVYQMAANRTIPVKSHRATHLAVEFANPAYHVNPLAPVFQGIPEPEAAAFVDYIASYQFVRKQTGQSFCIDFVDVRMADPLQEARRGVTIGFGLPRNLQNGRRVAMLREAGVLLNTPLFGMMQP